jgi:imidazolonepropionase-like amidohydrolase
MKRIFSISLLSISLAGLVSAALPQSPAPSRVTAITNVRIFDGERVVPVGNVIIAGGKIVACGPGAAIPAGAEVIDGKGKTLLPGLIDAHVHVISADLLKQALVFGVTAVVDMFMDVTVMQAVKKAQAEGKAPDQAFLVSSGTLATVAGGHGTEYGLKIPVISSPADAAAFVDQRVAEGSDFIKIIHDDGSTYKMSTKTLTDAEVAALIDAAHKRGKIAVIHAATLKNCEDALNAGVDALAHLYFEDAFDPDFGRLAARKKAFVIPTLSILRTMSGTVDTETLSGDPDLAPYFKTADLQAMKTGVSFITRKAAYDAAVRALGQLKAAGVPILAGTDAPNPSTIFGGSLQRELVLLVSAGLSPLEALRAATSLPADKFGMKTRGRVKAGFTADLLLVSGDPTVDIMATRRIAAIWKEGHRVDRAAYATATAADRKQAEQAKSVPAPERSETGLISDFDGDKIASTFGAGWIVSTDTLYQGKSQAAMKLVAGGAEGSRGALGITGGILPGAPFKWAGAMFSPGSSTMAPVNLSSKKSISFWAKGDKRLCAVEIFAQSLGFIPATRNFTPGPEWKEYTFPFSDFKVDGSGLMAIFIGAVTDDGKFKLTIDTVRLK